jgi:hypothetical protein
LCQRYFASITGQSQNLFSDVYNNSSTNLLLNLTNPVSMRAAPTGATIGTWTTSNTNQSTPTFTTGIQVTQMYFTITSTGRAYAFNTADSGYSLSAEL